MKQIIFITSILLFTTFKFYSQEVLQPSNEETFTEYMDKVLEPLIINDVSLCKNSILYDRVFPMANLSEFNNQDTLNVSNFTHFTRSLSELYDASIIPQTDVLTLQQIDEIAYHFEREGQIQIGIINMDFTMIDSIALNPENPELEIVDQKLNRIENEDPYIHKNAIVIAPIVKDMIYGENVVFEFGKIFIQKAQKPINDLIAVFENNQSFTIYENGTLINDKITVNFQESGNKEIGFDVTFSDGTSLTTFSTFSIQVTPPNAQGVVSFWSTDPFQGYFEPSDCNGTCFGKGEYKVYYKPGGNKKIMKPIIITDGFDPGDTRKIDGLVDGYPDYKMVAGFDGTLKNPKPETIYNMMYEYGSTETTDPNFINQLHALGFDVILLSFPKYIIKTTNFNGLPINKYRDGGSDYFERDAQVVKELIRIVNNELTINNSNEKIKLIAPSGAALLARIALVEMEQNGENHNVDLFVSFDGPHLGANVPIGLQKAAVYFGLSNLDSFGKNPLNNPWSKQSVINHYLANTTYPSGAPGYRDVFQNKMNNLGFPQQCRNIAFNNGSTGTPHASAGENMFYMYFKYWLGASYKREIWINFDSNSGSNSVFRWKKSHWRWFSIDPRWVTDLDVNRFSSTDSNYGSLDTCPGSYLDIIHRTYKNSYATFPLYYYDGDTNYPFGDKFWVPIVLSWFTNFDIYLDLKKDAIFMPSKSTLAYTGINTSWHEDLGCRDLVCTGETPFDSYYTPPVNQAHVSVHQNSVNWLLQELQGIEMDPVYSCHANISVIINGDNRICYNQTKTFTLSNLCNGNVVWSISSNLQLITSSDQSITVKNNYTDTGYAWIKATFPDGTFTKKDLIGKPSIKQQYSSNESEIILEGVGMDIYNQNITSVTWTKTGGNGFLEAYNNDFYAYGSGSPNRPWTITGYATVTNPCGSTIYNFTLTGSGVGTCLPQFRKIAKNQYRIIDPCDSNTIQKINESELYSQYGYKVQDLIPDNDKIDVNNTSEPGTIKVIKVSTNSKTISKLIIID